MSIIPNIVVFCQLILQMLKSIQMLQMLSIIVHMRTVFDFNSPIYKYI